MISPTSPVLHSLLLALKPSVRQGLVLGSSFDGLCKVGNRKKLVILVNIEEPY